MLPEFIFFVPTAQAQDRCVLASLCFSSCFLSQNFYSGLTNLNLVQVCFVLSVIGRNYDTETDAHLVTIVMSSFFFFPVRIG